MSDNPAFIETEDVRKMNISEFKNAINGDKYSRVTYDEALELIGHGTYNISLLFVCFLVIIAMGIDIFGIGIIVTAATCDLGLTLGDIGVLSSMPFAGIIIMSFPWGYLSDTQGRKLVLTWAMGGSFICSTLSSFAPNWQVLAALRFLGSALSSAAESVTYAFLGECCLAQYRSRYMLLVTSALMLTPTLYYVSAYFVMKLDFNVIFLGIHLRPWRLLTLVMALPLGLSAVVLRFFHESPKFLANVGRSKEAVDVLCKMYVANGKNGKDFPIRELLLEEESEHKASECSVSSLWNRVAPLFRPPLLSKTMLLFYLTLVVYAANNSFAIILPTIFNKFFDSLAVTKVAANFCDLFGNDGERNTTEINNALNDAGCKNTINDNTIWAGCAHGLSFFVINTVLSRFAHRRKIIAVLLLSMAATAALIINNTQDATTGLALFFIYLMTAMVFGVISSYFVDLYPTSYRGMAACLGMVVARLSAFAGINVVSSTMAQNCPITLYGAAALVFSGAIAAIFLPPDSSALVL